MGDVRFSCPPDLVHALAVAGGIDAAIETGTYKAEGTLILRAAVSRVWSIELDERLHTRAVERHGSRPGVTFLRGSSEDVLREVVLSVDEPVIFWLDAHGGMIDNLSSRVFDPVGDATQCPLIAELVSHPRLPSSRVVVRADRRRAGFPRTPPSTSSG